MSLPTVRLPERLEHALAARHPWVYRDHVPADTRLLDGDWVRVEAGRQAAIGLWSEGGAIAVRLLRFQGADAALTPPDGAWIDARVADALATRRDLVPSDTDAYRLLFGEGDGLPAIVADRYGRYAVVKRYAPGFARSGSDAAALLDRVIGALARGAGLRGVLLADADGSPPRTAWGDAPPPELTVREHGLRFLANLYEGQKTGLFLDHRENRATVRRLAHGRRVANLFAYSGAFSVHALAGGARHALDVDAAPAALRDAERNVAANLPALGADAGDRHATLQLDLLTDPAAALRHAQIAGADLIVLDPPSLARRKQQRHAALRTYRRLNAAALASLPDGGLLATASCTAQVDPEAFRLVLAEAALEAGVGVQQVHEAGHAADHPVRTSFPEGRYLKFVVLRVQRGAFG